MKKIYYILIIMLILNFNLLIPANISGKTIQSGNVLEISEENFPDQVLREILMTKDNNSDGYLSDEEIKTIKSIKLDKVSLQDEETRKGTKTNADKGRKGEKVLQDKPERY